MKKIIACILATSLFLASCGGGNNLPGGGQIAGDVIRDPNQVKKVDWRVNEYAEPIVCNVVGSELPYIPFPKGDSASNNNWTRAYLEELGIKTNFLWVCDSSQFASKLDMTIASGELPDVFSVSAAQFRQLVENDMIEDLSEVYLKYASDDLRKALEEVGTYAIDGATVNGRLMGIPNPDNSKNWAPGMWIRQDWLDKLGLKAPTTPDELEAVMVAFATKDPDGNGKADTFSGRFDKSAFWYSQYDDSALCAVYGAHPEIWYKKDGKIVYGGVQPEAKKALEVHKRLYTIGAINKEFTTIDASKAQEYVINDKVGMIFGGYYEAASSLRAMVTNTKKTDVWKFYELPAVGGGYITPSYNTQYTYHVVRKGYEHPEALIKIANMFMQEFTVNGTDHDRFLKLVQNDTGTNPIWAAALFQVYSPKQSLGDYKHIAEAVRGIDPKGMDKASFLGKSFYQGGLVFRDKVGKEEEWLTKWCWWVMSCPEYTASTPAMDVTLKIYEENRYIPDLYNGLFDSKINEKFKFLEQKRVEEYFKFVTGARPLDEWDDYVKEFYENGGKEVTDAVNAWYNNRPSPEKNVFLTTFKK